MSRSPKPQASHESKYCQGCGKKLHIKAAACPSCGYPCVTLTEKQIPNKNIATILALFLGGAGIHKFYLGQSGRGLLYLFFCWTFIPLVISLIEGIIYALTSQEKWVAQWK